MEINISNKSLNIVNSITKVIGDNMTFHRHYHILYDLSLLIDKNSINYVEIGCYGGVSSILMLHNKKIKCYSIDIGKPIGEETVIKNINKCLPESIDRFKYLRGNSRDKKIINELLSNINYIDILFIDGDHSKNGVIEDFKTYEKYVDSNGFIIFDDYLDKKHSPQVRLAVDFLNEADFFKSYINIGLIESKYSDIKNNISGNCYVLKKI